MFNTHGITRDTCQQFGRQANCGYDLWWHSFTGRHAVTEEKKAFLWSFSSVIPVKQEKDPVSADWYADEQKPQESITVSVEDAKTHPEWMCWL